MLHLSLFIIQWICTSLFSVNQSPLNVTSTFYQVVQKYWSEARIINNTNIKVDTMQEQVIWNNHYITIAKQHFYWKKWAKNGMVFIKNILNNDNLFLGYSEINRKYNIKYNFLDILQSRQSIPSVCRDILYKSSKLKTKHTDIMFIGDKIYNPVSLNTRAIYNVLTDKKKRAPSCIEK